MRASSDHDSARQFSSREASGPSVGLVMRLVLGLIVLGGGLLGVHPYRLPEVVSDRDSGLNSRFSAERALETIREIARAPHPTGHPENDHVREYLIEQLERLGFEVEVQDTIVVSSPWSEKLVGVEAARVRNITAVRQADRSERSHSGGGTSTDAARRADAVLLAAHYDTRAGSPGAADDSAGIAAILEVLRALDLEATPPERDIFVLFSDAEELGLYGARAFVDEYERISEIAVVINLEARGCCGVSRMFETTDGNADWIARFDDATGAIVADSLSAAIYRALPRDTDLTILRQAPMAGFNFAFIGGVGHYHTPLDRIEDLDLRSVQHQGESVLALLSSLVRDELPSSGEKDAVYFPLGSDLILLSEAHAHIFNWLLIGFAFVVLIQAAERRRIVRTRVLLQVLICWLLCTVAVALMAFCTQYLIHAILNAAANRPLPTELNGSQLNLALTIFSCSLLIAGWHNLSRNFATRSELVSSALIMWALISFIVSVVLPGAMYLASGPLCGVALVLLGQCRNSTRGRGGQLLTALGTVPALSVWPMTLFGLMEAFGPAAAPGVAVVIALLFPIIAPVMVEIIPALAGKFVGYLVLVAAILVFVVVARIMAEESPPRAGSIHYAYNASSDTASWVCFDAIPNEWSQQFLGDHPKRERFAPEHQQAYVQAAKSIPLQRIFVSVKEQAPSPLPRAGSEGSWRQINLDCPPGTSRFDLICEPPLEALFIRDPRGNWRPVKEGELGRLRLHAPEQRVELCARYSPGDRWQLRATAMRYGLPGDLGWSPRPRAENEIESIGDRTYVSIDFED